MLQDITKIKEEMVDYKYKHYKNGKIYLVLDIVIHTETQELMVVYRNINDEQIWCRPLSIFNEEIDNEHHKRFEKIDDDSDWKSQQEQAIFKEFEELGYECVFSNNKKHLVLMKNVKKDKYNGDYTKIISINSITKKYSCYIDESYSFDDITLQEHQLLHKLFEIWGWFDE